MAKYAIHKSYMGAIELKKLMPVLQNAHVGSAVQQVAVWIVTDNADYNNLGVLVLRSLGHGFSGYRIINEYEAAIELSMNMKRPWQ